jgi:(3,5-dihydroxyphenyl)acetyl-CoA 1,2-dioxygenase
VTISVHPDPLHAAGLPGGAVKAWLGAEPEAVAAYRADRKRYSEFWRLSRTLLERLPKKPRRSEAERAAAESIVAAARRARERFLTAHARHLYDQLTKNRTHFLRAEELVYEAAASVPGLTPTASEVSGDSGETQGDKDGVEIDQGIFLAHVLADEKAGLHLCHAMLLPCAESEALLPKLAVDGSVELGSVRLERKGNAVEVTAGNPRVLNAEDDTTLDAMEVAADLAILDPLSSIAVLRGGAVEHPKYTGRAVFGAGINLTRLYRGKIPYLWFIERDMGYVHKLFRGVALPDAIPDDVQGHGIEKPWIASVDAFAIGGHCQLLLVMDYVLAGEDAFMTLPARKEGIIPGLANLRLPRFVGDRIARQAIQAERRLPCSSPEGRLIVDEIVPAGKMDDAIERTVRMLTDAGAVGAIGNRRAFRVAEEPLDLFRRYCSVYAREQALCHFSPALIANLERNWNARERTL